jgi:diadenosine tetraphosphate (Ap4A) HIT family hydrolase
MMGADETHTGRDPTPCPFCRRVSSDESLRPSPDGLAVAIPDAYPLAPGHTLVVPRRHEPDLLGLTSAESLALWSLTMDLCREIRAEYAADGLTVGINAGVAAGQTVAHVHLHIVPRHVGDVPDPRGGIRWVLPERAAYWEDA